MGLSLAKEKATVLSLKKALNDGRDFKMQVVMMLDVSGSMHDEFSGGKNSLMESVLQRSLAFASEVDPNGKVEMVAFSDTAYHMGEMDISAFDRATDTFLKGARPVLWGGTDYAAAAAFSLGGSDFGDGYPGLSGFVVNGTVNFIHDKSLSR